MNEVYEKLISLFAAIYLFFACLPYGNQPVKVELSYEVKTTQEFYSDGDQVSIQSYSKNIGRPFVGYSLWCMKCNLFQIVDGEKQFLSVEVPEYVAVSAAYNTPGIVKHGDIQYGSYEGVLQNSLPGWYSFEIEYETYDGETITKVFENVIEVR